MSTKHDERLAELLAELSRERGRQPDWDALRERHPDLVDELRQLWTVGQMADAIGDAPTWTHTTVSPMRLDLGGDIPKSFGDFEIVEEIGRGGMGIVYKAWEKSLKRHVALKMILRGERASEDDLARFHREAQAAAGLSHPNIVQVFKVDTENGQPYFSMKYVEGETLAQRIKGGPLPQKDAARIIANVAEAVHHAHRNGILHRDLKPSNILIDADERPLVTDFGLAKPVEGGSSITGTGAIVGTPNYMAPEQAEGDRQAQPASDIYSLGAILYELLTGRPPFLAAGAMETLMLACHEEPVRPRLLNPKIDLDLEFICRKCLEKRPKHRYADADALANDLHAYLQGEPVSARSSSMVYFVTRLFRETHHAPVLENWGVLWMWHSLMILLLCVVTSMIHAWGVRSHWPFLVLWSVGLAAWGSFFWYWRRRAGPVTFVERQIAHAWMAGVIASVGIFVVEVLLQLPVLILSPVLPVIAGIVFLVKAGTLSGWFYIAAAASFATAVPMSIMSHYEPNWGPLWFGVVSAMAFFVPGLKYYRQRLRNQND